MSAWISKEWFSSAATNSGTTTTDAGNLDTTTNPWSSVTDSVDSTTGGSGVSPSILLATDCWLRNENGEVITDESGNGISLEGLGA
jgi:hypothetical protein